MNTPKYTKYGMLFGFIVVISGLMATLLYGYRPAPKPIMKPSLFETARQVGIVALKRFYVPLANEKLVVFGIPTNRDWSPAIVSGFLEAAGQNKRPFATVIIESQISDEMKNEIRKVAPNMIEVRTNTQTLAELVDAIRGSEKDGGRVLLVVPNIFSTHLLPGNMISRLETALFPPELRNDDGKVLAIFSLSVGPLALEASEEKQIDPACMGSERDGSGTVDFGCAIVQASRFFYRKRILDKEAGAREKFVALMQSPGPNDYLLLVRAPDSFGKKL